MFGNRKQQKLEVIIGSETVFRGELESKGTVRVDGRMEGNVIADSLIIGDGGMITGDAKVREMIVGGRIVGNIRSTEGVEIQQKGEVYGDISSIRLTIAEGGRFDGRSTMQRPKEITYNTELSDEEEQNLEHTQPEPVSLL